MELDIKTIVAIVVPVILGLGSIIGFLSKWIVKSIKKGNETMYKEVILNKVDIVAMDNALNVLLKIPYGELKKTKKDQLIQRYTALGKLDHI